jgi:L-lysine 6-transaminase
VEILRICSFSRYLEIIEEYNLVEHSVLWVNIFIIRLMELMSEFPDYISNVRGKGLMCAFEYLRSGDQKCFA